MPWRTQHADASLHRSGIRRLPYPAGDLVCDRCVCRLPSSKSRTRQTRDAHSLALLPRIAALHQKPKHTAAFASRLNSFQVGAIALQYAPDACGAMRGPDMRAVQQCAVPWPARFRSAYNECLSIQTCSGGCSQCCGGRINFGCGIGPDFAICLSVLGSSSFKRIELYGLSSFMGSGFLDRIPRSPGNSLGKQSPLATKTSRAGQA